MNNTTNNSKTNNTEIGNNINRNSQLNANNGQDTNLKSHSIYRRFLPGLLMLLLGVVILSAPVAANAQISYILNNATFYKNMTAPSYLVENPPTIMVKPNQWVKCIAHLYKKNYLTGTWNWVQAGPVQQGQADSFFKIWTPPLKVNFNLDQFGRGTYKVSAQMYTYEATGWVYRGNWYVPSYDYYDIQPAGVQMTILGGPTVGNNGVTYMGRYSEVFYPGRY